MDAGLLRGLRAARQRQLMELARKRRSAPGALGALVERAQMLMPLVKAPLDAPRAHRFVLDAAPRPNSKSAAVVAELTAAGVPRGRIWPPEQGRRPRPGSFLRRCLWLPWALGLGVAVARRAPRLDRAGRQFVVGRAIYRRAFAANPALEPVILSDTSADRFMIWAGALAAGSPVMWWQDDAIHSRPLALPVTRAAVVNLPGLAAVRRAAPGADILRRPGTLPQAPRPIPEAPRVGVAVNALFSAAPDEIAALARMRDALGVPRLSLRLHPNSRLRQRDLPGDWLEARPADEPLESFAEAVDLALTGNSAVQLKLVCAGVPVALVPGLDPHPFDTYGYVARGFVYGAPSPADLDLGRLRAFYARHETRQELAAYVSVPDEEGVADLSALAG